MKPLCKLSKIYCTLLKFKSTCSGNNYDFKKPFMSTCSMKVFFGPYPKWLDITLQIFYWIYGSCRKSPSQIYYVLLGHHRCWRPHGWDDIYSFVSENYFFKENNSAFLRSSVIFCNLQSRPIWSWYVSYANQSFKMNSLAGRQICSKESQGLLI